MTEEYFDLVDENNIPTGNKATRKDAHSQGLWHRTVHIYLIRNLRDIEFLVHLRAKTKDLHPNKWDTRFGGHLKAGETIYQTLKSELYEEVGIPLVHENLIEGGVLKRDYFPNREFTQVYYYLFDQDESTLKFNDGEVQEVKWLKTKDVIQALEDSPSQWSSNVSEFITIVQDLEKKISTSA